MVFRCLLKAASEMSGGTSWHSLDCRRAASKMTATGRFPLADCRPGGRGARCSALAHLRHVSLACVCSRLCPAAQMLRRFLVSRCQSVHLCAVSQLQCRLPEQRPWVASEDKRREAI